MERFTILLAGRALPTPALRRRIAGSRVVAADAGMRHAPGLQVTPELWVGDFDSAPQDLLGDLPAHFAAIERRSFSADKDRTDGEIAIDAAIERGAKSLILVGALGGPRSDHAFSHLVVALRLMAAGYAVELLDGVEHAIPLCPDGRHRQFEMAAGTQLSILKFGDLAGFSIDGVRYPLDHVDIAFTSILTQSNEAKGTVGITLERGKAVLLAQADPKTH